MSIFTWVGSKVLNFGVKKIFSYIGGAIAAAILVYLWNDYKNLQIVNAQNEVAIQDYKDLVEAKDTEIQRLHALKMIDLESVREVLAMNKEHSVELAKQIDAIAEVGYANPNNEMVHPAIQKSLELIELESMGEDEQ